MECNDEAKVRSIVFRNIEALICDLLPPISGYRVPLTRAIFGGLSVKEVSQFFPKIPYNIIEFALNRTGEKFADSNLFEPNIKRKKTGRITDREREATLKTLDQFFEFKSGQRYDTKYTRLSRREFHDAYVSVYHDVVVSSGLELSVEPRCYKTFYNRLLRGTRIVQIRHPHDCPICSPNFEQSIDAAITRFREIVIESHSQTVVRKAQARMKALTEKKNNRPLHVKKMTEQRDYYKKIRAMMGPDDCILVMDYVSTHYSAGGTPDGVGGKYNILIIAVEFRPAGEHDVIRRFFDYPCCIHNNKHDLNHLAHAFLHLFNDSNWFTLDGKCAFKNIWRVSDNGQPFKSTGFMYLESYIAAKFQINYEVIFLCPYHAFSICDGHGGAIKKVIGSAHVKRNVPTTAAGYRALVDPRVQDTHSYPIEQLNIGAINDVYELVGGYGKLAASEPFKNYSSFKYITGNLLVPASLGCAHVRLTALMDYNWEDVWGVDKKNFPSWRFMWFIKHPQRICVVCPFIDGRIVFSSEHECPFKERIMAYKTARNLPNPPIPLVNQLIDDASDDDDSDYSSPTSGSDDDGILPQRPDPSVFEIEEIINHHVQDGIKQYYVKWTGYPESENTWEVDLPHEAIAKYEAKKSQAEVLH